MRLAFIVATATLSLATHAADLTPKPAEPATAAANARRLQELPFTDRRDFDDARRGFIASVPDGEVKSADGRTVYTMKAHRFLEKADAPASVTHRPHRSGSPDTDHAPSRYSANSVPKTRFAQPP